MPTIGDVNKVAKWNGQNFDIIGYNKAMKPFHLYFENQTGAVTVPASTTTNPLRLNYRPIGSSNNRLDDGFRSPFLWDGLVFASTTTASAAFTLRLTQDGASRRLMDFPQHILNIAGTAQTPAILREYMIIDSNSVVWAELQNTVDSTTTARVYMRGKLFCPWTNGLLLDQAGKAEILETIAKYRIRRNYIQPFWASPSNNDGLAYVSLSANATATFNYKNGDDANFEAFLMNSVSTGAYAVEVSIPRRKQTISNGRVTNTNGTGTANFPMIFPTSFMVLPGYDVQFKITDLSGSTNNIYISLQGRKIYAPPSDVKEVINSFALPAPADVAPGYFSQYPYKAPEGGLYDSSAEQLRNQ